MPEASCVACTCAASSGETERARGGGDLQADEAAADDRQPPRRVQLLAQRERVGRAAQHGDVGEALGQRRQPARVRAGGEHQPRVGQLRAGGEAHDAARAVDRHRRVAAVQRDALLGVPGLGAQRLQRLGRILQEGLGQRRALVGQQRLVAHEVHARALPGLGQRGAELRAGMAAPDDDDRLGAHAASSSSSAGPSAASSSSSAP
jgi:hypothetical protein